MFTELLECWSLYSVAFLAVRIKRYAHVSYMQLFDYHGCTNCSNLEMEPNCLQKSDIQLNPSISRTKNGKSVL